MINRPKPTNTPLNSQLIYINHISMFLSLSLSAWGCLPQTPEPTVLSSVNVLFHLAIIHHHIWWTLNPSSIIKSSTCSLLLSEGRWCSGWDALMYLCDSLFSLFTLRSPALHLSPTPHPTNITTTTTTVIKQSSCIQTWWSVSLHQPGRKLDDGSWFVEIRNSSALRPCDWSRHAARTPLVNKLYWELHDGDHCCFSGGFPQFASDIANIIHENVSKYLALSHVFY